MRKMMMAAGTAIALALSAPAANAVSYTVDAFANSSSGGTGLATFGVVTGQALAVTVAPGDLWNAGALPRWSNADGLTGPRFATGTDDSAQPVGTLIGVNFGTYTQGNLSAPYGTLVGQIGSVFQVLGTNFSGPAWGTGVLSLFYWDSNNGDNTQFITANVSSPTGVPAPAALGLFGLGLLGLGAIARRRA